MAVAAGMAPPPGKHPDIPPDGAEWPLACPCPENTMPTRPQDPQPGRRFPSRALPGSVVSAATSLLLCACGLGDVGGSAATAAKLKAQEAEQRRKEIEAATR